MRNGTSQSPFRTRSSTADCAPAVPVTGTPSQHRFARCDSVASSRDDSTPRSDARFVSPLALTHVGYTVSPRGFRGLTASAFSLPWRSAKVRDRSGSGIKFHSALLPPYLRRTQQIEELLPWLCLKNISTGDFQEALAALLGKDAKVRIPLKPATHST